MKKALISLAAVAFLALMITNVYAPCIPVEIPEPEFCGCLCPGFTPGFWKHNIQVYLGEKLDGSPFNGAYSAFEGGPRDGEKLTDTLMEELLDDINEELENGYTFLQLLGYLYQKGWSPNRTNTANWFNWAAGYGPYNG